MHDSERCQPQPVCEDSIPLFAVSYGNGLESLGKRLRQMYFVEQLKRVGADESSIYGPHAWGHTVTAEKQA